MGPARTQIDADLPRLLDGEVEDGHDGEDERAEDHVHRAPAVVKHQEVGQNRDDRRRDG